MKNRVITGILLAVVLIPIFYFGGIVLDVVLLLFSMVATWEMNRMFNKERDSHKSVLVMELVLSGGIFYAIRSFYQGYIELEWIFFLIILLVVLGSLALVFSEKYSSVEFGNTFVSVLYPSLGFGAISGLRGGFGDDGLFNIGFLFLITTMTDMFAYIVGVNFGKHRLAVKISPKKSIEGSIGGTAFAIIFTLIFIWAFKLEVIGEIPLSIFVSIILIIVISCIGQIGDLVASKLKRDCGIKDYSNLFPGHGGVMDRFDSAIFAAMVLMLISKVVGLV